MRQIAILKEIETEINENGDIVISKDKKDEEIVMGIEEYRKKILEEKIEKKLLKAEKQIDEENKKIYISHMYYGKRNYLQNLF